MSCSKDLLSWQETEEAFVQSPDGTPMTSWRSRKYLPRGLWMSAVLSPTSPSVQEWNPGSPRPGRRFLPLCLCVAVEVLRQPAWGAGALALLASWCGLRREGLVTWALRAAHGPMAGPQTALNALPAAEALVAAFGPQGKSHPVECKR